MVLSAHAPRLQRLLRLPQVEEATGLRRTQIFVAVKDGRFPKPVKVLESGRAVAWLESDVVAYQQARIAARDAA